MAPSIDEVLSMPQLVYKVWKRQLLLQICRHLRKVIRTMENQGNTTKENIKLPVNDPKEKEIQKLLDIEFQIIAIKILRE